MKVNSALKYLFTSTLIIIVGLGIYQYVYLPKHNLKNVQSCSPINFRKEEKESTFYLKWETKEECTGYVKYGTSESSFPYLGLDEQGVVKLKGHSVKLNGVEQGSKYFFVIVSDEKNYGSESTPIPITF